MCDHGDEGYAGSEDSDDGTKLATIVTMIAAS